MGDQDHRRRRSSRSISSSHSIVSMSRWFVGSSSSSRSGCDASARAERRARQLAARERRRAAGRGRRRRTRARGRPRPPGRASRSRPRARAAPARTRSGASSAGRARRRPSPARARAAPPRGGEIGRAGEDVLAQRPLARRRRPLVVERDARALLPRELAALERDLPARPRSSVVLPAPFGPASASRSRRSTLNETPSKSGVPESSLRRLDAIRTATLLFKTTRREAPDSPGGTGRVRLVRVRRHPRVRMKVAVAFDHRGVAPPRGGHGGARGSRGHRPRHPHRRGPGRLPGQGAGGR